MGQQLSLTSPTRDFENIMHADEKTSVQYWTARELMPVLGYTKWENFVDVIKKAKKACLKSGQIVENHFLDIRKMTVIGGNAPRSIQDWKLDRYACYLITQNGDPTKEQIALAQTYFAVQTRRQELFEQLSEDERRLFIRNEVSKENKKLFSTAKKAGVINFGYFNDAGYRGLYTKSLSEVEEIKGVSKGQLLDRAGSTELAANLFRITQTDEKLKKDNVKGQQKAAITHLVVGRKVRETIMDINGTPPENLPPEKDVKQIKKGIRILKPKTIT